MCVFLYFFLAGSSSLSTVVASVAGSMAIILLLCAVTSLCWLVFGSSLSRNSTAPPRSSLVTGDMVNYQRDPPPSYSTNFIAAEAGSSLGPVPSISAAGFGTLQGDLPPSYESALALSLSMFQQPTGRPKPPDSVPESTGATPITTGTSTGVGRPESAATLQVQPVATVQTPEIEVRSEARQPRTKIQVCPRSSMETWPRRSQAARQDATVRLVASASGICPSSISEADTASDFSFRL